MLNAFCRVAPSVRFNFLAILAAGVFLRAMVFSSRTSVEVHARRFFDFLGINPPYQIGSWYPLAGAEEIGTDRFSIMNSWSNMAADTAGKLRKGIVRSFLAIYRLGSNCNFQTVPPRFFDGSRPYYASSSGSASIASTKKTAAYHLGARKATIELIRDNRPQRAWACPALSRSRHLFLFFSSGNADRLAAAEPLPRACR